MPTGIALSEARRKLLQRYLRGGIELPVVGTNSITARCTDDPAPLSLSQEQIFLREATRPDIPPLYNECVTLRMAGPLDVLALERSYTEIIRRHNIWRTSYDVRNGRPVQIIRAAPDDTQFPVTDLEGLPRDKQEAEVQRIIGELVQQRFDLTRGPLLRAKLVRLGQFEHRLYLVAHLSVVDGISVYQVFPCELATLYSNYSSGQASPLRDPTIQFDDYAYWQRHMLQGEELAKQVAYWRRQLAGDLPALRWPTDRPRPAAQTFRGAIHPFTLSPSAGEAVKQLRQREGVTLFMTLLAAFTTLLHCYTQQEDIVVGTPSPAGRKRSEVQGLLGYFLNPVALRFDLTGNPTFRELLRQTQRLILEAISNDDVPIEHLSQDLQSPLDPSRNPFFTVAMSLQPPMAQLDLDWSVTSMDIDSGGAVWDLYIAFIERPGKLMGRVQYNPDLFEASTITRMLQQFQGLLENVGANSGLRLSETDACQTGPSRT